MFIKAAHSQRQELAQQRREDKRRAEKEKLMAEEDPERARKMEVSGTGVQERLKGGMNREYGEIRKG